MTPDETAGALAYANQLDPRLTLGTTDAPNVALHDLWSRELRHVPDWAVRAALLDYYAAPLPQGVYERRKVEPHDVRRLASKHRPRCADHDEWPADRCLPCRDEVADGNRAPELYGRRKWPDAQAVERVDVSQIGQTPA